MPLSYHSESGTVGSGALLAPFQRHERFQATRSHITFSEAY
jgi:hypothetical protein